MKLKRRFLLNLLTPAPIAATLLVFTFEFLEKSPFGEVLRWLPIYILFGYIYAILPSVAHAWWLHHRYHTNLAPRSRRAVAYSTLNGLAAGTAISLFFTLTSGGNVGSMFMFVPLGAATGALNGLLQFLIRDKLAR